MDIDTAFKLAEEGFFAFAKGHEYDIDMPNDWRTGWMAAQHLNDVVGGLPVRALYQEGFDNYFVDIPCPDTYKKGTREYDLWWEGWNDADDSAAPQDAH